MHWRFLSDSKWLFLPDPEWRFSPDANNSADDKIGVLNSIAATEVVICCCFASGIIPPYDFRKYFLTDFLLSHAVSFLYIPRELPIFAVY